MTLACENDAANANPNPIAIRLLRFILFFTLTLLAVMIKTIKANAQGVPNDASPLIPGVLAAARINTNCFWKHFRQRD
jgi:hypothetical protein